MTFYAPNISWLLPETPFSERPGMIAQAGFKALEFGFPSHADISAIEAAQSEFGFQVALFNQDVPVWEPGNRGYLSDPSRRDEFVRTLDEALQIVKRLQVQKVMLPAGVTLPDLTYAQQRACVLENLRYAAPLAAELDVIFTIELLNPHDNSGYFLTSIEECVEIVKEVNHPNIRVQFDTYHVQRMEGNLTEKLVTHMPWIGHIQFADVPGRHEPGTGELNFEFIRQSTREAGYQGPIGLEYIPLAQGMDALAWCQEAFPG